MIIKKGKTIIFEDNGLVFQVVVTIIFIILLAILIWFTITRL